MGLLAFESIIVALPPIECSKGMTTYQFQRQKNANFNAKKTALSFFSWTGERHPNEMDKRIQIT
jgi:hypothetical protein